MERVEVKDVRVPENLQRAMAAEAEAAREARAKVIAAEGEHKASRALRHAAEVVADSPAALQLRYLQTLNSISAENNSTIIFPVPIDVISCIMGASSANSMPQVRGTLVTTEAIILDNTNKTKAIRHRGEDYIAMTYISEGFPISRTNIMQNNNTLLLEGKLNNNTIVGGDGNFSSLLPAFIYVRDSEQTLTTRVC